MDGIDHRFHGPIQCGNCENQRDDIPKYENDRTPAVGKKRQDDIDANMRPFAYGIRCSDPGNIDKRIAGDFFSPDRRIGKEKTAEDLHKNGQHDHGV